MPSVASTLSLPIRKRQSLAREPAPSSSHSLSLPRCSSALWPLGRELWQVVAIGTACHFPIGWCTLIGSTERERWSNVSEGKRGSAQDCAHILQYQSPSHVGRNIFATLKAAISSV